MSYVSRAVAAVVLAGCLCACDVGAEQKGSAKPGPPAQPSVAVNETVLHDFQQRVEHYIKFQRGIEKQTGKQKETEDPAQITRKQDALADQIRALRKDAKQGDIFTPEIAAEFRRLLAPELKGREGREIKQELKEDVHEDDEGVQKKVPMRVNAKYPEGNALPTVPTSVLQALPTLPEDIEYRIIDRNLILRDVDANIIVDFIPNAIR